MKVERLTVDLASYPDLIVIYLGMRVRAITGLKTLIGFGPKISNSVAEAPDGLLRHESILYSLFPPHVGMRQYWRDFDSLERWTRSEPHRTWWKNFLRDSGGTGFWHETYFMRGGIEAIYDDIGVPLGLSSFAPTKPARGPMFSARTRSGTPGSESSNAPVPEAELYMDQNREPGK
jgi:Domain of unknown function (DUF4188)